jgi:hypothetical protein
MTRDYWFDGKTINTSSFCVVHEITEPMNWHENNGSYALGWNSKSAQKKAAKKFQNEINL